jgi:CYTH domain-containing protein
MALVEIERKFLVDAEKVKRLIQQDTNLGNYDSLDQGYLVNGPISLRVRHSSKANGTEKAELTLKGPGTVTRYEQNIDIPVEYSAKLLQACPCAIFKHRYHVGRWEIDRFINVKDPDTKEPLMLAEIELSGEDEVFERPDWLGKEVSDDLRYTNAKLSETAEKLGVWGTRAK